MTTTAAVLDYGMGNLRSVSKALERVGACVEVVTEVPTSGVDLLVVPGQGHFGACVRTLGPSRMGSLGAWIAEDRPYLGICLGSQVLFSESDEDPAQGLGVLPGAVVRLSGTEKIPHIGWNTITVEPAGERWFEGLQDQRFYFVHSYHPSPADPDLIATRTGYGESFCSAVARGALLATQFHPEKSGEAGLALLERVLGEARAA